MTVEEKILDKAHELFIKNGLRSVTMDELAQSLGISKRTIYEHFADKEALVEEDAKRFSLKVKGETERIINEADNVIQGVTRVMLFLKGMFEIVTPMYFSDMKRYYPSALEQISKKREIRKFEGINMLVKKGQEQGVFRSDLNVELVSFFVNGVLLEKHEIICDVSGLKYGDFERDVLFAYFIGIATEEGHQLIKREQEIYFSQMSTFGLEIPKFKF